MGTANDLDSLAGVWDIGWVSRLEKELLLKEIVGYMSTRTRLLYNLRTLGFSWNDIAKSLGTTANNVQSQFSQGIAKVRRRVLGKTDSSAARARRAE